MQAATQSRLKAIHFWIGTLGFLLFVATGQYMVSIGVPDMDNFQRLLEIGL